MKITPEREDSGLFASGLVQLDVELAPIMHQNRRGDLVVKGCVEAGDFDVLFAGRRLQDAAQIVACLKAFLAEGPLGRDRRLRAKIEGSWRSTFSRNAEGEDTRRLQFIAARWSFVAPDGQHHVAGKPALARRRQADH